MMHLLNFVLAALAATSALAAPVDPNVQARDDAPTSTFMWTPALGNPSIPIGPALGNPSVQVGAPALGNPSVQVGAPALGQPSIPLGPALGNPTIPITPALGGDLHFGRNEPGKPITDHQQSLPKTNVARAPEGTATLWAPALGTPFSWTPAMGNPEKPPMWAPALGQPQNPPVWAPAMGGGDLHLKREEGAENPWATRTAANAIPTWLTRGPAEAIPPWATRTAANAIPTWLTRGPESS